MPTRTISVKEEAYRRLKAVKRYPGESFSEVVMRAMWPEDTISARQFLALHAGGRRFFTNQELDRIEAVTQGDRPPVDKWRER